MGSLPAVPLEEARRGNGLAFALALVIQRAPAFLLLPLLARYVTPAEYGQIAILLAISLAGSFILSFGLETAILRTWIVMADRPVERETWMATVGTFLLTVPLAIAAICIAGITLTDASPFGLSTLGLALALLAGALYATSTALPFAMLRAQERLAAYFGLSVVMGIGGSLATVVAVVALDGGVEGWLLARVVGFGVVLAVGMFVLPWPWPRRSRLSRVALLSALAFGLPLLPHLASQWVMAASDRVVLGGVVTDADLGQYATAATLCSGLLLLYSGLSQASMPAYARAQDGPGRRVLSGVITTQVELTILLGLAGAILLPPFINEVFPAGYQGAAALCPPLVLAYTLAGLYFVPMNAVTLTFGRTRWVWLASGSAAIVSTFLIFLLGNSGGVTAAVFAPVAAYGVLLVATSVYVRSVATFHVGIDWEQLVPFVLSMLAVATAVTLLIPDSGAFALAVRSVAVLLVGIAALRFVPGARSAMQGSVCD